MVGERLEKGLIVSQWLCGLVQGWGWADKGWRVKQTHLEHVQPNSRNNPCEHSPTHQKLNKFGLKQLDTRSDKAGKQIPSQLQVGWV
eukprot:74538-Amphidinium_carterae.1